MAFVFGVTGRRCASRLLFWRFVIIRPRLSRHQQTARAAGTARLPSMVMMMMVVTVTCCTAGRLTPQAGSAPAQAVRTLAGRARRCVPAAASGATVTAVLPLLRWMLANLIVFIVIVGGRVVLRVGKRVRGRGGALQSRPCVLADRYLLMMVMRRTGSSSHLSISCGVSGTTL